MQVKIKREYTKVVTVWGCDGCQKPIEAKVGDEIVQIFYKKMDTKVNGRKLWKTTRHESYHRECYKGVIIEYGKKK